VKNLDLALAHGNSRVYINVTRKIYDSQNCNFMTKTIRNFAVLVLLITAGTSFADGVLWKINDKGQKVFYNDPPKTRPKTSANSSDVALIYSKKFDQYSKLISAICERHGVAPALVKAVIQVESNYNDRAVSHVGASGLMQLMPATAARYGVISIFEPSQNIEGGVRYLKDLLKLFNSDLRLTIAAYNAGENRVLRLNDVPAFIETQNYVRKVLALYNGEMKYKPYSSGDGPGKIKTVTYYKYVDDKGIAHYSTAPVSNSTKISFDYSS
jgi:transglycosylase-like protein with SLT domain